MSDHIICEKCGNDKFAKGIQKNQAKIVPIDKSMSLGSVIIHTFCTECGWIKESFVEKPNKFI